MHLSFSFVFYLNFFLKFCRRYWRGKKRVRNAPVFVSSVPIIANVRAARFRRFRHTLRIREIEHARRERTSYFGRVYLRTEYTTRGIPGRRGPTAWWIERGRYNSFLLFAGFYVRFVTVRQWGQHQFRFGCTTRTVYAIFVYTIFEFGRSISPVMYVVLSIFEKITRVSLYFRIRLSTKKTSTGEFNRNYCRPFSSFFFFW